MVARTLVSLHVRFCLLFGTIGVVSCRYTNIRVLEDTRLGLDTGLASTVAMIFCICSPVLKRFLTEHEHGLMAQSGLYRKPLISFHISTIILIQLPAVQNALFPNCVTFFIDMEFS